METLLHNAWKDDAVLIFGIRKSWVTLLVWFS